MLLCCGLWNRLTAPAVLPAVSYRDSKPRDNIASSFKRAAQARAETATASSRGGRVVIGITKGNTIGIKKGNTVAHPCVWR